MRDFFRLQAIAICALMMGCGPQAQDAAPQAPEPAVVETPAPDPALARWKVSGEAFGAIAFGMSVEAAEAAAREPLDLDEDPYNTGCVYGSAPSLPAGMYFMVYEGSVVRVDLGTYDPNLGQEVESLVRSAEGIGIGSTEEDVLAAYGARASVLPSKYGGEDDATIEVLTLDAAGEGSGLVFETTEGIVTSWRAGLAEQVSWVEGCS